MWLVEKIDVQARELDFSSAGMGRHPTTALLADGVELVNALDLAEFSEPTQLTVCEQCGTTGCNSGGWVSFRRLGTGVIFVPCFSEMVDEGRNAADYEPPYFMRKRGIPFFVGPALTQLEVRVPFFEDLDRFPPLSGKEAVRVMQWEAPSAILGRFPDEPKLRSESVAAVNPGDDQAVMAHLTNLLSAAFASDEAVVVTHGEPVTFYVDLPGCPEWIPLLHRGAAYSLVLGGDVSFLIVAAQPAP